MSNVTFYTDNEIHQMTSWCDHQLIMVKLHLQVHSLGKAQDQVTSPRLLDPPSQGLVQVWVLSDSQASHITNHSMCISSQASSDFPTSTTMHEVKIRGAQTSRCNDHRDQSIHLCNSLVMVRQWTTWKQNSLHRMNHYLLSKTKMKEETIMKRHVSNKHNQFWPCFLNSAVQMDVPQFSTLNSDVIPTPPFLEALDGHQPKFDPDLIKEIWKSIGLQTSDERLYKLASSMLEIQLLKIITEIKSVAPQ